MAILGSWNTFFPSIYKLCKCFYLLRSLSTNINKFHRLLVLFSAKENHWFSFRLSHIFFLEFQIWKLDRYFHKWSPIFYIKLFYSISKQEWCAASYFSLASVVFFLLSRKVCCFALSHIGRYTGVQERSLGFAFDDDMGKTTFQTCPLYEAKDIHSTFVRLRPPFRHFERSQQILLALCSSLPLSQVVPPFPLSHIRRYTPYRHFERSEKSSLHSVISCFLRKWFPVFRYLT